VNSPGLSFAVKAMTIRRISLLNNEIAQGVVSWLGEDLMSGTGAESRSGIEGAHYYMNIAGAKLRIGRSWM
jgi:hypothetical protein